MMSINLFSNYPLSWKPVKATLTRPYYQGLARQMRADINNGLLLPGTKLPPQRELADYLDVGFTTITRAYKLSQAEGLTYGVVGKGTYVSPNVKTDLTITHQDNKNIQELGFVSSFESENGALQSTIINIAKQKKFAELLNYEHPTGMPRHKKIATRYLREIGMNVNQQNTLIASGGQNALTITLLGLFNPGDKIIVDQFTYVNFIELCRLRGVKLIPIPSDNDGIRSDLILKACQNDVIKGIYLMPDCNNPTTEIITLSRRKEIATIIKHYDLTFIEDDYANFLNLFREVPVIKLSELVPENSVYICSMSKPLASGLRVAFMRVPDRYKLQIELAMFNSTVKTSALDAAIVVEALENGTANKIMHRKINKLLLANQIFDRVFEQQVNAYNATSFFRPLHLKSKQRGDELEKLCLDNGIRIFHSDRFLVGPRPDNSFLRVSLSAVEEINDLTTALKRLKSIIL
ncbi:PLP-dependent aminotransferase family protein [Leuconostoc pseudomesenteroides]|uniref:aminotransferase-like domain-containing protein n=1 Tax=Leuconostoc pseudomesenteroides TaxID=33968 RepID=UPI001E3A47BD|nr:PLP-dependent aminotransferase family protein [Leuconostoc pseudomesenteroides]